MQGHFTSIGIQHEFTDFFHAIPVMVGYFNGQVEDFSTFIHLWNYFPGQSDIDKFGKFR